MTDAYTELGGTLIKNTQVESSGYTFDLGKISGTNKAYFQTYGSSPYYAGIYSTNGTTESSLSVGNGLWNFETDRSGEVTQVGGTEYGFSAEYMGSYGIAYMKVDSGRLFLRGIPAYTTHAAATSALSSYQLYRISNGRGIFFNQGDADYVSPNLFDNNTYVGVLNSKPFALGQWTTAGRPTGVSGYMGWNTTLTGIDWYNGTRWATGLESTFARGTATYVPHFDGNGQLTEHTGIRYNASTSNFGLGGAPSAQLHLQGNKSASSWTTNGIGIRQDAATYTNTTSSGTVAAQYIHSIGTPTLTASSATTITNSATLAILAAPVSSTNITQTNSWAIYAPSGQSRFSRVVAGEPGIYAAGLINSYYLTSHLHAYGGNDPTSRAAITAQSLGNAAGLTKIGVIGSGNIGSGGTSGTLYGVIGETGQTSNMASGTAVGIMGNMTTYGATNISLIGVASRLSYYSVVGGGSQTQNVYGFRGEVHNRNNNGGALLQGFSWAGITTGSVAGSNTGITNYNPLAINQGSGTLSGITNIWSYIDHKTSIGSATQGSEELDVFGDIYIRDSTRLTTTPAHTAITGILTRDASGWVGLATIGTGLSYSGGTIGLANEIKRDTTIYVTDADYNFAAALTSAQILARYNNIIIYSKLTASATSDNQIILHSASSDFLQCTISIYSNDASADADATSIDFTTNGAVDGAGGTVSTYGMVGGEKITIRAVNDSGYKWIFN